MHTRTHMHTYTHTHTHTHTFLSVPSHCMLYCSQPGEKGYKIPRGMRAPSICCPIQNLSLPPELTRYALATPLAAPIITSGGMFTYVSGANYFGEIVEWVGFALAVSTLPAIAFALFTAANIGPRACHHHK